MTHHQDPHERNHQMRLPLFQGGQTHETPMTSHGQDPAEWTRWRCLTCGQLLFMPADETPPDTCDYCQDMTTWQNITPAQ